MNDFMNPYYPFIPLDPYDQRDPLHDQPELFDLYENQFIESMARQNIEPFPEQLITESTESNVDGSSALDDQMLTMDMLEESMEQDIGDTGEASLTDMLEASIESGAEVPQSEIPEMETGPTLPEEGPPTETMPDLNMNRIYHEYFDKKPTLLEYSQPAFYREPPVKQWRPRGGSGIRKSFDSRFRIKPLRYGTKISKSSLSGIPKECREKLERGEEPGCTQCEFYSAREGRFICTATDGYKNGTKV
jgi:hypothetical protein